MSAPEMTDAPKPKLTIVDELFANEPEPRTEQERKHRAAERTILARHVPAIVKRGRQEERAELALSQARLIAAHAGEVSGIKQAHTEELARHDERWSREEAKHGSGKFWSGMATGLFVAGAAVAFGLAVFVNTVLPTVYDSARQMRVQDDVLRTLQRPPTTNEPRSESAP